MYATCFGLYLGHPLACKYKNLIKEDIITSKGPLVYSLFFIMLKHKICNIKVRNLNNFLKCIYKDFY